MKRCTAVTAITLALVTSTRAEAAPVWVGDFETNDTSQWSELNGDGHISVVGDPVIQGAYAAQIQLTNDAVWPNGLKRVELHHGPAAGRTAEGAETYFAWSFYLPETLPTDPSQTIGYWESNTSYQQMMAFNVAGEHVQFITQKPQYTVQWEADGMATAATWHRIAMHVTWSKDPGSGKIDVWFDGAQVVNGVTVQTLADDNDHFTQVGLLRGAIEFQDSPIIVLDDAVEGDTLDDVHPDLPSSEGGGGSGSGGAPSIGGGGNAPSSGGNAANGGSPAAGAGGPGGSGGGGSGDSADDGCGCKAAGAAAGATPLPPLLLVMAIVAFMRRRVTPMRRDDRRPLRRAPVAPMRRDVTSMRRRPVASMRRPSVAAARRPVASMRRRPRPAP